MTWRLHGIRMFRFQRFGRGLTAKSGNKTTVLIFTWRRRRGARLNKWTSGVLLDDDADVGDLTIRNDNCCATLQDAAAAGCGSGNDVVSRTEVAEAEFSAAA